MRLRRLSSYVFVFVVVSVSILLYVYYLRGHWTKAAITTGPQRIAQATWDRKLHKYVRKKSSLLDTSPNTQTRITKVNSQIKVQRIPKGVRALPSEPSKLENRSTEKASEYTNGRLPVLGGENDTTDTGKKHNSNKRRLKDKHIVQSSPKKENTRQKPANSYKKGIVNSDQMCHIKPIVSFGPFLTEAETNSRVDFNLERTITFGSEQANTIGRTRARIPKIMHLIWSIDTIPTVFTDNVKSFVNLHPDWNVYFWALADGERFLHGHYPKLLPIYRGYKYDVSRSDTLRYVALYHYGGAYFDLDTRWHKTLSPLVYREECMVSPEPEEHAVVEVKLRSLLGTAALLCRPKHPLYRHILDQLMRQGPRTDTDLMTIAGPTFLTNTVSDFILHSSKSMLCDETPFDVHIASYELFYDIIKPNSQIAVNKLCTEKRSRNVSDATQLSRIMSDTTQLSGMCVKWNARGGMGRTLSRKAFSEHEYFGAYNRHQKSRLVLLEENRIEKIVPRVKRYPFK